MRRFLLTFVAVTLVSSLAFADPDRGKPGGPAAHGEKKEDKKDEKKDDKAGVAAGMAKAADDDDEGPMPAADAGKPVAGRRTPAQLELRKQIWERREKAIDAKVHKGGKRHLLSGRTSKRKRQLRRTGIETGKVAKKYLLALGQQ